MEVYVYKPREDSFLILRNIKRYIKLPSNYRVLDMGTGTGILAKKAAKSKHVKEVTACDINKKIIEELKKKTNNKKIKFIVSNLFSNIKTKFDIILFNPPYLPSKSKKIDIRIDGGKNGTEIIEKFLKQAKNHLKKDGKILLVCSSLNKNIENLFKKYIYNYKKIDEENFFFEKIYLYLLSA